MLSAADHLPAAAHHGDGVGDRRLRAEQDFLGIPAGLRQHAVLSRIQAPCTGQTRLNELGEREVHVVAAEQQVIADGLPHETESALLLHRADEAEIARAAADIDDETQRARL